MAGRKLSLRAGAIGSLSAYCHKERVTGRLHLQRPGEAYSRQMLETYRVQVRWDLYASADQTATNTFYFRGDNPATSEAQDIAEITARIAAFWSALDVYLPNSIFGASPSPTVVIYRMSDPPMRLPIYEDDPDVYTTVATTPYPSDVAICLSYHAAYSSGVNRARRRGRIFIGPVISSTGTAVANQGVRVAPAVVTAFLNAAELLAVSVNTSLVWVMWSETDQNWYAIIEASVDDQFDTRRSRDRGTSTRSSTTIP